VLVRTEEIMEQWQVKYAETLKEGLKSDNGHLIEERAVRLGRGRDRQRERDRERERKRRRQRQKERSKVRSSERRGREDLTVIE
jgi:hypothetical protein